ncbi:MAG: SPFH domain-containing protein [Capnocytophaga sp.]|nr:SPFH domain-containing protein [Capnocytophaga sp.]
MNLPFIEIIEWVEQSPNLLLWKFPDADKEIKNGARLIVRESQSAAFLNEGDWGDVFRPGTHKLETKNIPILSRMKGWKYGFESPFKADVYFISTKQFVNLKWGTPAPILMPDPKFGQVRVRAFGTYNVRITGEEKFFKEYAGTYPQLTVFELECQIRDFIAPKFGEVLANANLSVTDIAGNISALNERIAPQIQPYFEPFGIEITAFTVSSVTLPDEVTAYYDKVTGMNMIHDMDKFQKFNTAIATSQPNTAVNAGMQQGMAMGMMMNQMAQNQNSTPQKTESAEGEIMAKLKQLKALFEQELISEDEYKAKRTSLLDSL